MGYTSRFLTLTKGTGVINRIFHEYGEYSGEMESRRNGALISMEILVKLLLLQYLIYKQEVKCLLRIMIRSMKV